MDKIYFEMQKPIIIDLHLHTNNSDGVYSVEKVIDRAIEKGIEGMSITDHDSVAGIKIARKYCKGKIEFITGIEFTCREEQLGKGETAYSIHLLGYGFDEQNKDLCQCLEERAKNVREGFEKLIASLEVYQMYFTYEDVPISCGIVMQLCDIAIYVKNRYPNSIYLKDAKTRIDGYAKKMSAKNISLKEAIELIHMAGGKAVWAHPFHVYQDFIKNRISCDQVIEILEDMIGLGIDGIESGYLGFTEEERSFLGELGKKHNMILTAGSDFHGSPNRDAMIAYSILI